MDKYKGDMEAAMLRMEAWWETRELPGRPMTQVRAPRNRPMSAPMVPHEVDLATQWRDAEYNTLKCEAEFARTYYGGEAFPILFPSANPCMLSAYMGSPVTLMPDTTWQDPILSSPLGVAELAVDRNSIWWTDAMAQIQMALERNEGNYLVTTPDLGGGGDVMANLIGTTRMLEAMVDEPDAVRSGLEAVSEAWVEAYHAFARAISLGQRGQVTRPSIGLWHPGSIYPIQCDVSAMVSPAMFEATLLPDLSRESAALDCTVYHLDGPDALRHVDTLLGALPIRVVQWVPGAGTASAKDWVPLLRRVQDHGVSVMLYGSIAHVLRALEFLDGRHVMVSTWAHSEDEAKAFLSDLERKAEYSNGRAS